MIKLSSSELTYSDDEIKTSQIRVFLSMIISIIFNAFLMFVYMICVMYTLNDLEKVQNISTELLIIKIYYQIIKNKHATNILIIMMMLIMFLLIYNIFASVFRLI